MTLSGVVLAVTFVAVAQVGDVGASGANAANATAREDGVQLTIRLQEDLVAGESALLRATVTNTRDMPILLIGGGCSVTMAGQMTGATWRPGETASGPRTAAEPTGSPTTTLRADLSRLARPEILLSFERESPTGDEIECSDAMVTQELAPGDQLEVVGRWDGLVAGGLGPPPSGPAGLAAILHYMLPGDEELRVLEATLESEVTGGWEEPRLHPMEVLDTALADPGFKALMASSDAAHEWRGEVGYDLDRGVWYVGACGWWDGERVRWKAATVDPASGAVSELIDAPGGADCEDGPWADG